MVLMSNQFKYQSDDYDRHSQRFVIPLYVKDELGNYQFSSTGTLAKYNGHHYIIFAAHALSGNVNFEHIYTFFTDGDFYQIQKFAIGHQIYDEEDIVIVDCFNKVFDGKNYFNLNLDNLNGFEKKYFAWTGFPSSQSNSKKIHKSKSKDTLKNQYIYSGEEGDYFKNAKYFTIISRLKSNNKVEITGDYDRKNANLKYAGPVSTAPHPSGMSGGAMYFFAKGQKLMESLDDTFRFAGIGIEYRKDNAIVGVPRVKIIDLLDKFDNANPLQFIIQPNF